MPNDRFKIEPMREQEIEAILEIETACGLNSRSMASYRAALADSSFILLMAVLKEQTLIGSKPLALFSGQIVVDELQVDNIAVLPGFRRLGLGSYLLETAFRLAREKGAVSAVLEVRANNRAALSLYEREGFVMAGRRRNYYHNPTDDALTLTCKLLAK